MNLEASKNGRHDEAPCPLCKGKGFLTYDVPYGNPLFDAMPPCPMCSENRAPKALAAVCGLPPKLQTVTFDKTVRHPGNAAAYDAALERARQPREFLTLTGPTGVGKSCLLAAIVNEALSRRLAAYYTTTADLLDLLRSSFQPGAETDYESQWERLKTVRVLTLDELDRFNQSDWALEKFFQLMSARFDYGHDRLTCFASNAGIDTFPAYLQSRMRDRQSCLFELTGMDVRLCAR